MYNRHFSLQENPFNQTPDSDFFFPSDAHKAALDALIYAIRQRKGFCVITGEIGSGKTTVTRTLLRKLDRNVKVAVITNTHLSPKGVLTMILEDLGVPYKDGSKDRLLIQLNEYLLSQIQQDQNVMLLVDEAQNLSPQCLEEVRMLSNLETEKEKLIQIILVGQPELKQKLELPNLEQLRQRVAVHYHIEPLDYEDMKNYIVHRLETAKSNGADMSQVFEEDAMKLIYQNSRGVPRIINNICDHALLTGFISDQKVITESIALEAIDSALKI